MSWTSFAGGARNRAPLLKQRIYQPQGWPTLIFENSIVGSGSLTYPRETSKREAAAPFFAQAESVTTAFEEAERELELMRQEGEAEEMAAG